jgi:hypothetical protein
MKKDVQSTKIHFGKLFWVTSIVAIVLFLALLSFKKKTSHRTVLIKRLLDKSKQGKVGFVKNHNPGGENAEQPSI